MPSSSEFANIPGMTREMRESVAAAFDALSNWKDEIETANERCLRKTLSNMSAVARSMGWPDHATRTMREYLENTSKMQTELIDQVMEGWKKQLKSPTDPMALPRSFAHQIPGTTFGGAMPEFNALTPWTFWMQAAEMWQRTWMPDASPRRDHRSH